MQRTAYYAYFIIFKDGKEQHSYRSDTFVSDRRAWKCAYGYRRRFKDDPNVIVGIQRQLQRYDEVKRHFVAVGEPVIMDTI